MARRYLDDLVDIPVLWGHQDGKRCQGELGGSRGTLLLTADTWEEREGLPIFWHPENLDGSFRFVQISRGFAVSHHGSAVGTERTSGRDS